MIGTTLSHYAIEAELGRGGMGIVYKARDTKLDRELAIKVLPSAALASADDRERFYREAKSAAALNHPNIAQVYQIDEAVPSDAPHGTEPSPFIAMEYIAGGTLQDKIKEKPLSLPDAVKIASQVAEALKAAHAKDIVHRDIKSANVMITEDGVAKVLDFGLAKTNQSTMLTRMGSTLGTVAYMSPEQTRGEAVDGRTDLWALGVMLYEMVAGRLPFAGDYEQAVTYSILNEDPEPLTALRTGVPMELEWLVDKLLSKSPDDRYLRADDVLVDLRRVDTGSSNSRQSINRSAHFSTSAPLAVKGDRRLIVGGILTVVLVMLAWWIGHETASDPETWSPKRLMVDIPSVSVVGGVDISPDGSMVAFAADDLRILFLETGQVRSYPMDGLFVNVDFSPDNTQVLVTNQASVERVDIASGAVVSIVKTREGGPRATWAGNDGVVYEEDQEIWYASVLTGESRQLVARDSTAGEFDMDYPVVLADGKTLAASIEYESLSGADVIGFWDLESGKRKGTLNLPARRVDWIEPGYLIYMLDGDVMAMPFDLDDLSQTGPAIQIDRDVAVEGLSVSQEGTLVHAGSNIGTLDNSRPVLPMVFRATARSWSSVPINGNPAPFPAGVYRNAVVSPDRRRVAIVEETSMTDGQPTTIWLLNLETGIRRAMTTDGISDYPAWSSTGDSLFFVKRGESDEIWMMAANGRGGEKRVATSGLNLLADLAISPDGRWVSLAGGVEAQLESSTEFFILDFPAMLRSGKLDRSAWKLSARGNARGIKFSPDSKYVLYEDQGGIYVQLVEDQTAAPEMIWPNSILQATWGADGKQIIAAAADGSVVMANIQLDPFFAVLDRVEGDAATPMTTMGNILVSIDGENLLAGRGERGQDVVATDTSATGFTLRVITDLPGLLK